MAEAPSQSVDTRSTTVEASSNSSLTSSTSVLENSTFAASGENAPRLSPTTTPSDSESKSTDSISLSSSYAADIKTVTTTMVLMFTSDVDTVFPTSPSESIRFEAITIVTDLSSADGESITVSGSDEGTAGPPAEEDDTLLLAISTSTVSQDISRLQPVPPPQSSSSHSESLSNDNTFENGSYTAVRAEPVLSQVYETTLGDGTYVTESALYETRVPIPTAQSNGQDNIASDGRERPTLPGIYEPVTNPPVGFFKKPAAAAGVFIAIMLVLGSLVWMFFIIRRHRQAVAAAANQKRPIFAYGST
ncbi:13939_t:CDS:2, partial [Acaulospora colombiana]